jgi:hypothetical protein
MTISMEQHAAHLSSRFVAMGLAAVSLAAMFYVGLYQSRAVWSRQRPWYVQAQTVMPEFHGAPQRSSASFPDDGDGTPA